MNAHLFSADFQAVPYWRDAQVPPLQTADSAPKRCDVLVIGGGYTGLSAALELARRGAEVLVLESGALGHGCSGRNGGQISDGVKPSFASLAKAHGAERAGAIIAESERALAHIGDFIAAEDIDCDFRRCGRFHGAHSRAAHKRLTAEVAEHNRLCQPANRAHMLSRGEQGREIATDAYHGGAVFPAHCSVHPMKLLHGIARRARAAGARILPQRAALTIKNSGSGFSVATAEGDIFCRRLILATNGYTGTTASLAPWHRRRIIPIGSHIIATEPLADGLMPDVLPTDRVVSDTRRIVYYYRSSPDRRRMIFGGRVSFREVDAHTSAPLLHREMSRLFPQLAAVRISHSWCGFVGFTFDKLMHVGCHDGIHYALGYCGSGVALSIHLGTRIARQCLGDSKDSATAFDGLPFAGAPFYTGTPWFLAMLLAFYKWRDSVS